MTACMDKQSLPYTSLSRGASSPIWTRVSRCTSSAMGASADPCRRRRRRSPWLSANRECKSPPPWRLGLMPSADLRASGPPHPSSREPACLRSGPTPPGRPPGARSGTQHHEDLVRRGWRRHHIPPRPSLRPRFEQRPDIEGSQIRLSDRPPELDPRVDEILTGRPVARGSLNGPVPCFHSHVCANRWMTGRWNLQRAQPRRRGGVVMRHRAGSISVSSHTTRTPSAAISGAVSLRRGGNVRPPSSAAVGMTTSSWDVGAPNHGLTAAARDFRAKSASILV